MRLYQYVGPPEIAARSAAQAAGVEIATPADVMEWFERRGIHREHTNEVTVTYVVDREGRLRIADRRSEHVACAGGGPVQAAGEMTFLVERAKVEVVEITNQSAGYCPEPSCWQQVEQTLTQIGITHPEGFTHRCEFRRCPSCHSINLVKDSYFRCEMCRASLPVEWNLSS